MKTEISKNEVRNKKSVSDELIEKGVFDAKGNFVPFAKFKRNPSIDHVWIPGGGKNGNGTSISMDEMIARIMEELLGGRQQYIVWARKATEYVQSMRAGSSKTGIAGTSRLVQREAVAFIREHSKNGVLNDPLRDDPAVQGGEG